MIKQVCTADLQASKTPVISIISVPLIAIEKGSAVEEAPDTLIRNKVIHLGVRDGSNNKEPQIIGIISSRNLVKLHVHKLGDHDKLLTNKPSEIYYWQ